MLKKTPLPQIHTSQSLICKLLLASLLILPFFHTNCFAQSSFKLKLVDAYTALPISGAALQIAGVEKIYYTKITGWGEGQLDETVDSIQLSIFHKKYLRCDTTISIRPQAVVGLIAKKYALEGMFNKSRPLEEVNVPFVSKTIHLDQQLIKPTLPPALVLAQYFPGLTVTREGGNPNKPYQIFNRGFSSISQRNYPLVIVDGVPELSLERINIEDISSIKVTNSALGTAQFGALGSPGVIEIETVAPNVDSSKIKYHVQTGMAFRQNLIPILTAEEYALQKPLFDQGAETDWMDIISQKGMSNRHHLSYSSHFKGLGWYASLGYEKNRGILKRTGFEQGNAQLSFQHINKAGNVKFRNNYAYTQRDAELGNPGAIWSATFYNPTIPVYDEFGELTVRETGFSRTLNPLGEILHKVHLLRTRTFHSSWLIQQQVEKDHAVDYQLAFSSRKFTSARFDDDAIAGFAEYNQYRMGQLSGQVKHKGRYTLGNSLLQQYLGFSFYVRENKNFDFRGEAETDQLSFKEIESPESIWSSFYPFEGYSVNRSNVAIFAGGTFDWNIFTFSGGYRYDRIFVGKENIKQEFFNSAISTNFKSLLPMNWINKADLTVGFGKSGALTSGNETIEREISDFFAGEFLSPLFSDKEQFIEQKTTIDLRINVQLFDHRLNASLNFYDNFLYNQIIGDFYYGDIGNKGIEAYLSFSNKRESDLKWTSAFTFFKNQSTLFRYSESIEPMTVRTALSSFDYGEIWLEPYGDVGQYYGFSSDGSTNGSGHFEIELDENDLPLAGVIGQTKPDFSLMWNQQVRYKSWDFSSNWRAIIGHDKYNYFRQTAEFNQPGIETNEVRTKYYDPLLNFRFPGVLNYHLEKASFLKLDYLAIGFRPKLKKGQLRIYLEGHELWTLTGYTGLDPEPVYQRNNITLVGNYYPTNYHFRTRQIKAGIQLAL